MATFLSTTEGNTIVCLFVCLFVCTPCIGGTANTAHLDGRDVLGYDVCRVGSGMKQSALKPANAYKGCKMKSAKNYKP